MLKSSDKNLLEGNLPPLLSLTLYCHSFFHLKQSTLSPLYLCVCSWWALPSVLPLQGDSSRGVHEENGAWWDTVFLRGCPQHLRPRRVWGLYCGAVSSLPVSRFLVPSLPVSSLLVYKFPVYHFTSLPVYHFTTLSVSTLQVSSFPIYQFTVYRITS